MSALKYKVQYVDHTRPLVSSTSSGRDSTVLELNYNTAVTCECDSESQLIACLTIRVFILEHGDHQIEEDEVREDEEDGEHHWDQVGRHFRDARHVCDVVLRRLAARVRRPHHRRVLLHLLDGRRYHRLRALVLRVALLCVSKIARIEPI